MTTADRFPFFPLSLYEPEWGLSYDLLLNRTLRGNPRSGKTFKEKLGDYLTGYQQGLNKAGMNTIYTVNRSSAKRELFVNGRLIGETKSRKSSFAADIEVSNRLNRELRYLLDKELTESGWWTNAFAAVCVGREVRAESLKQFINKNMKEEQGTCAVPATPLTITKEKVLEAASKCSQAKETLKTLFPEVFEKSKVDQAIAALDRVVYNPEANFAKFNIVDCIGLGHLKSIPGNTDDEKKAHVILLLAKEFGW